MSVELCNVRTRTLGVNLKQIDMISSHKLDSRVLTDLRIFFRDVVVCRDADLGQRSNQHNCTRLCDPVQFYVV